MSKIPRLPITKATFYALVWIWLGGPGSALMVALIIRFGAWDFIILPPMWLFSSLASAWWCWSQNLSADEIAAEPEQVVEEKPQALSEEEIARIRNLANFVRACWSANKIGEGSLQTMGFPPAAYRKYVALLCQIGVLEKPGGQGASPVRKVRDVRDAFELIAEFYGDQSFWEKGGVQIPPPSPIVVNGETANLNLSSNRS